MVLAPLFGARSRFDIAAGYKHRSRAQFFDATVNSDDWQREVYAAARGLMFRDGLKTVYDVGCGSGSKLIEQLGEFETLGIDLPGTIEKVRLAYPNRQWLAASFEQLQLPKADLVICADVVEHVSEPDKLMQLLSRLTDGRIVVSTPARELMYAERELPRFGPPDNPAHIREWTMAEFRRFAGRFLAIERHELSNTVQCTQLVIGTPLKS